MNIETNICLKRKHTENRSKVCSFKQAEENHIYSGVRRLRQKEKEVSGMENMEILQDGSLGKHGSPSHIKIYN